MNTEDDELENVIEDMEEGVEDPESLAGSVAALVDLFYLDEILVALAREVQSQAAEEDGPRGDALLADARALREAVGKLSGEM